MFVLIKGRYRSGHIWQLLDRIPNGSEVEGVEIIDVDEYTEAKEVAQEIAQEIASTRREEPWPDRM